MSSPDDTRTSVIARISDDTGQLPAVRPEPLPVAAACPYEHHALAWHRTAMAALILAWLALGTAAYVVGRIWLWLAIHR